MAGAIEGSEHSSPFVQLHDLRDVKFQVSGKRKARMTSGVRDKLMKRVTGATVLSRQGSDSFP